MKQWITSNKSEDTFQLGENIGKTLTGGEVLCLYGELGAGKTVFAKGLAHGLGVETEITSPTFTLIQEYPTARQQSLVHMDLYRLQSVEEAEIIGVPDYFRQDCICLIEWPEIILELLPEDSVEIRIEGSGDLPRSILINANYEVKV